MEKETELKKIALPCCGSCGYYGYFFEHRGCQLLKLREIFAKSEPCKFYIPRNFETITVVANNE